MKKNLIIHDNISILSALKKIDASGEKCLVVTNSKDELMGTLSDGDLRRAILKNKNFKKSVKLIYNKQCKFYFEKNYKNKFIVNDILNNKVSIVPIVDQRKKIKKILTIRDIKAKNKNTTSNIKKTIGLIMAGGKGIRMKPFTNFLPKPLIPIKNQTAIDCILSNYEKSKINKVSISINYKAKIMKAYFEEKKYKLLIDFIEEKKPLGTIGCLSQLKLKNEQNILITNCDIIANVDYAQIVFFHEKEKNDLTIVCSSKQYEIPYGVCEVDAQNNFKNIREKPKFNFFINIGIYILKADIKNLISKNKKIDFDEFIKFIRKKNKKIGLYPIHPNHWYDVGAWNEYKKIFS